VNRVISLIVSGSTAGVGHSGSNEFLRPGIDESAIEYLDSPNAKLGSTSAGSVAALAHLLSSARQSNRVRPI
jgi:hypothetical protein